MGDFLLEFELVRILGGGGVFVGTLLWLLSRGDGLRRENVDQLREQRDEYRRERDLAAGRADRLQAELDELRRILSDGT